MNADIPEHQQELFNIIIQLGLDEYVRREEQRARKRCQDLANTLIAKDSKQPESGNNGNN
ncbi:MAG: hypothetical protein GY938_20530 [Ketobacter sp.]|nr:hypothetical protein [Ketobacter sp.]